MEEPGTARLTAFDDAVAVRPAGAGSWEGVVADGWDMGGVPNGGYLTALALHALAQESGESAPTVVTASFLAPAAPGPVQVSTTTVARGARLSTRRAHLAQDGRLVSEVTAAFGPTPDGLESPDYLAAAPPELPDPDACVHPHPDLDVPFRPPPITRQVEMRLKPSDAGFALGTPSGTASMAGWMRFADERPADLLSLPLFADAFPPAVFNAGLPLTWVPTVQLTVHLRGRPAPGWLRGQFRTRLVAHGYLEEDGDVWDAQGRLVAMSRQLALAPRAEPPGR